MYNCKRQVLGNEFYLAGTLAFDSIHQLARALRRKEKIICILVVTTFAVLD